ncbi:hypothetical protein EJ08DRAFT_665765 [Tothia fuscella]|uniref:Uncharacterized protein n=1 Tax=Tothia fuscella TaxID=1048955 RepID=A0A9P4TTJ8_9PEZI|nr:hypothetical protein EJ08DRAFT_665765 [Tothia fuscella]
MFGKATIAGLFIALLTPSAYSSPYTKHSLLIEDDKTDNTTLTKRDGPTFGLTDFSKCLRSKQPDCHTRRPWNRMNILSLTAKATHYQDFFHESGTNSLSITCKDGETHPSALDVPLWRPITALCMFFMHHAV